MLQNRVLEDQFNHIHQPLIFSTMKTQVIIVGIILLVLATVAYLFAFNGWEKLFSSNPENKKGDNKDNKMCVTLAISKKDSASICWNAIEEYNKKQREKEIKHMQEVATTGWDSLDYSSITSEKVELKNPRYFQNPSTECGLYDVHYAKWDIANTLGTSQEMLDGIRAKVKGSPELFLEVLENAGGVVRGIMKLTGTKELFQRSFEALRFWYDKKDKKKIAMCNKFFEKYVKEKILLCFVDPGDEKKLIKRKKCFEEDVEKMVKSDPAFFEKDS